MGKMAWGGDMIIAGATRIDDWIARGKSGVAGAPAMTAAACYTTC